MSTQFPVHPDDVEQLLRIRRYLIGFRHTNGWTQPQLSQMINGTDGMVYDLETNMTWQWRLSRLQAWPVPFGLRLQAKVAFKRRLDKAVHEHPEVAPAFALSRQPGAWAMWQRVYLTSALTVARKQSGMGSSKLGQRLGITRKAIWNWEATAEEIMLPKLLHHARALGGRIDLSLEEQ